MHSVRRVLLTATALSFVVVGPGRAADVAAPVLKAPPPVFTPNWGGWYVGGHIGYGTAAASTSITSDVSVEGMTAEGAKGAIYGVHGGYNYQIGRAVVGVEADWSGADLSASSTVVGGGSTFIASEKIKSLGSVRGRAGIGSDQLLLYGTAGFAWANAEFSATDTSQAPANQVVSSSRTMTGFVYGGGVEFGMWNNVSVRAEYLRYVFGSAQGPTTFDPGNAVVDISTSNKVDAVDVVRVGATYHFFRQAASAPAVAASWGGWYIGGHVGYGTAAATTSMTNDFDIERVSVEGAKGAVYGVHGGYNYQLGRAVVGVEADWSGANLNATNTVVSAGLPGTAIASEKIKSLGSVRGRAGIGSDQLLLYGTAGFAWADAEFSATDTSQAPANQVVSSSRTMTGFVYGGGVEFWMWNNVSVRAEYLRYVFGSAQGPTRFVPGAGALEDITSNKVDSVDVVRVGATYHFLRQASAPSTVMANWTGWYVGGHVGYGIASATTSVNNDVESEGVSAEGAKGAIYGAQAGYNHQIGRAVFGIEGDWTGADVTASNTAQAGATTFIASEKIKSLASLRGRAGLAVEQLLLYATAGAAWARADFSATDTSQAASNQVVSASRTMTGFVYGGGAEWALWTNVSVRAEYLRYVFGSAEGPTRFDPGNVNVENITSNKIDAIDTVRVGLNWRFSSAAPFPTR